MKKTLFLLISFASFSYSAQFSIEQIADYDQVNMVFTVRKTYDVLPDDVLIIPPGAKVQFLPLTGINVKGELLVDGKADRQVTLTSQKGMRGLGAPYDWAGITVFPTARVTINYAVVSFASFGVKTCCDNVSLLNTVFYSNGVNFQIGDRRMYVVDREPMSYEITPIKANIKSNPAGVDYDAIAGKRYIPKRTWILSPIVAALIAGGIVHTLKWIDYTEQYNDFGPGDPRFADVNTREKTFKELSDKGSLNMWLSIGLTTAGLGLGTYVTIYTLKF